MAKKPLIKKSDLLGITRMITDATLGITNLVEAVQRNVVDVPYVPKTPIQGMVNSISGIAYNKVRLAARLLSNWIDKSLRELPSAPGDSASTIKRDAAISALNGVIGDYLESSKNPLAIKMQLRFKGEAIPMDGLAIQKIYPNANGKILLMVHGLCMNDIQWNWENHDHGAKLAEALNLTPIYLHYNTGLHISTNGKALNNLLEELIACWPVPLEELMIIGHSMGGLVSRSAFYYATKENKTWTRLLKKLVFMGTPHHGAPLAKAGIYADNLMEGNPYVKPFARLGKIRSSGLTDLRHGNMVDEDWKGVDRFEIRPDDRLDIPLPEGVECYAVAAATGDETEDLSSNLLGDGLVGLESALGKHKDPERNLQFKSENTLVVNGSNHLDLLANLAVYSKLETWLFT